MESYITLQDVANIVTFVVPGYIAIRLYSRIYAKGEKEFSRLLIESIVCSLPIVTFTNWLWQNVRHTKPDALHWTYVLLLLVTATAAALIVARLRMVKPVRELALKLGLGLPDEDFMRLQFARLHKNSSVTLTLRNGEIFSGTPSRGSTYTKGDSHEYYFDNLAWYNKDTGQWDERPGGLILSLDEVRYIETPDI